MIQLFGIFDIHFNLNNKNFPKNTIKTIENLNNYSNKSYENYYPPIPPFPPLLLLR